MAQNYAHRGPDASKRVWRDFQSLQQIHLGWVRAVDANGLLDYPIWAIGNSTGPKANPRRSSAIFLAAIPGNEAEMIRPLNPKAKTILKVAIPLAVVAFVLFFWANARPVPVQVQLTFIGFTNLTETHTTTNGVFPIGQAYFCMSNAGNCSVLEDGGYAYEVKNMPFDGIRFGEIRWMACELKPGEFQIFLVPAPGEPWRLWRSISKVGWRGSLHRKPSRLLQEIMDFVPEWLDPPREFEIHSDWINGPELMPVASHTAR